MMRVTKCDAGSFPVLAVVIPCYNEESVLPMTAPLFLRKIKSLAEKNLVSPESRILFVDDGSADSTWEIIRGLAKSDAHFEGIRLSRNRGHQNALLAGLMEAKDFSDITVSIDCDGQDDIDAIDGMIKKWRDENCDIVYGVRSSRKSDSFFKRFSAEAFYRLLNRMGAETVFNHADYRLVSSRVLGEFANFREVNLFLRGMFPLVGFKSGTVFYERRERLAGKSHYPLSKMLHLAFDGITSLSVKPIHLVTAFGSVVSAAAFAGVVWTVVQALCGKTVAGWASTTSIVCFVSGIQILSLGVIGEYVGKIYLETKRRPRYVISERTREEEN